MGRGRIGSFTFYTRGVDRLTSSLDYNAANILEQLDFQGVFENPDALWNSLMQGIYDYIQANGGQAIEPSEDDNKISRVNWMDVKEVLLGNRPITDIGCN